MAQSTRLNASPMTEELAVKLRDHNYPQPTYQQFVKGSKSGIFYLKPVRAYGPPIHELLDKLTKVGEFHRLNMKGPRLWIAEAKSGKCVSGSSPVEALANLWCALNKRKIKRKTISPSARL